MAVEWTSENIYVPQNLSFPWKREICTDPSILLPLTIAQANRNKEPFLIWLLWAQENNGWEMELLYTYFQSQIIVIIKGFYCYKCLFKNYFCAQPSMWPISIKNENFTARAKVHIIKTIISLFIDMKWTHVYYQLFFNLMKLLLLLNF